MAGVTRLINRCYQADKQGLPGRQAGDAISNRINRI